VVNGGLDGKALSLFELILPSAADLHDFSAKLMSDDDRIIADVLGHPFMLGALDCFFVGRHADTVGNNMGQNFVITNLRKLELFEAEVVFAV